MAVSWTRAAVVPLALSALPLAGCDAALTGATGAPFRPTFATATVTYLPGAPAHPSDSSVQRYAWAGGPDGDGVFSVGDQPVDGRPAIPPGRYGVTLLPGATAGSWMICDQQLCGARYQGNAIATGYSAGPHWRSTLDVGSEARAVWLFNVVLTPQSS